MVKDDDDFRSNADKLRDDNVTLIQIEMRRFARRISEAEHEITMLKKEFDRYIKSKGRRS